MSAPMTSVTAECHICGTTTKRSVREVMAGITFRHCAGCRAILSTDAWRFPDGVPLSQALAELTCAQCRATFKGEFWKTLCPDCYIKSRKAA